MWQDGPKLARAVVLSKKSIGGWRPVPVQLGQLLFGSSAYLAYFRDCAKAQPKPIQSFVSLATTSWPEKFGTIDIRVFGVLLLSLGTQIFLTFQTNLLGALYYTLRMYASQGALHSLQPTLGNLFPVIFGLGTFLTVGYYGLDHFNPEAKKLRKRIAEEKSYPAVHLLCHLVHGFSLPAVMLDVLSGSVPTSDGAASVG
eukprot:6084314-Amphidinium_carterae.1